MGSGVGLTDESFHKILARNSLQHLETFDLRFSNREDLTVATVELLLATCPKLYVIQVRRAESRNTSFMLTIFLVKQIIR